MCFHAEVIQVKPDWLPLTRALATPPNQKSHRTATIWVQLPAHAFRWTRSKRTLHSLVVIKPPVHVSNELLLSFCPLFRTPKEFWKFALKGACLYFALHQLLFLSDQSEKYVWETAYIKLQHTIKVQHVWKRFMPDCSLNFRRARRYFGLRRLLDGETWSRNWLEAQLHHNYYKFSED